MARFDRSVPPGGEGKITLVVDTKGFHGYFNKKALVLSNDPKNSRITIGMKGKIWAPIEVTPGYAQLRGLVGEKVETTVRVESRKKEPLELRVTSVSIPDKVIVELEEAEKGRSYVLRIGNNLETEGMYGGEIVLASNYPEKSELGIRITGNIVSPVSTRPKMLRFKPMSMNQLKSFKANVRFMWRPVMVVLNRGNDLKIEKAELENALFQVKIQEMKPGRMFQLLVKPVVESLKKGVNMDRLRIYTNKKNFEVLVVPVQLEILEQA